MQKIDLSGNALWTNNGIVVSNAIYDQINPNIDTDNTNAYVVWQDSSAGEWNISASKIDANGNILWNTIVCNATDNQTDAKNIYDNNGGTILVWKDKRNNAVSKWDIYAQRVFSNGSLNSITENFYSKNIDVKVFPNPAKDNLFIQAFNSTLKEIIITDLTGKIIYQHSTQWATEKINISNFNSGFYFITIKTIDNNTFTQKFIIQ